MRNFLMLFGAVGLFACVQYTDPNRYCAMKGDTTGLAPLYQSKDSIVVACIFTTEPVDRCFQVPFTIYTRSDCVEGTKWKGPY
jgi:hypothetical protein